jgi:hypothetical protein
LCPNYGFPYESHFKLPIIKNKITTKRIFKSRISSFEQKNNVKGLWTSLNFVKKSKVRKYIKNQSSLFLKDHRDITKSQILRLQNDPTFKDRQKAIASISTMCLRLGFLNIFRILPNLTPYMKLEITKLSPSSPSRNSNKHLFY